MSHSGGAVLFANSKTLYYEYDGTSDVPCSRLYDTQDEMQEHWRKDNDRDCNCGKDEPVRLMSTYGGGFAWDGKACQFCYAITDGGLIYNCPNYEDTEPVWSPWLDPEKGQSATRQLNPAREAIQATDH